MNEQTILNGSSRRTDWRELNLDIERWNPPLGLGVFLQLNSALPFQAAQSYEDLAVSFSMFHDLQT